jgi:hypothetical protein
MWCKGKHGVSLIRQHTSATVKHRESPIWRHECNGKTSCVAYLTTYEHKGKTLYVAYLATYDCQ